MNESVPPTDGSEDILAQFVQELAEARDPAEVVAKFQAAHPPMAGQLQAMADMMRKVEGSCPDADTELPPCLGGFRLVRRIAHGGMGEVFEAREERLHRRVAVKIVHRQHFSPVHRFRFLREQWALAQLHQTHIVPIFAAGEQGPFQYFAMPYIEGAALHHALDVARRPGTTSAEGETPKLSKLAGMYLASSGQSGPATAPDLGAQPASDKEAAPAVRRGLSRTYFRSVAQVMADVAEALHHAHRAGIIHRDVKPSNIMIAPDEKCWIIDFGLARYRKQPGAEGPLLDPLELTPDLTAAGGVMGTPRYMAPEQWTDPEKVDARADVWGLGATLYELLTLQPAFRGASEAEVRQEVLTASPAPPRRQVRGLSADLDAICLKALQKLPDRRYATAQDFAEDLRRWLRDEPPSVVRARRWRQLGSWARHNKGWAAAPVLLLLAVLGALVGWSRLEQSKADVAKRETDAVRREADAARRSVLLLEMQQARLSDRKNGWSQQLLHQAGEAAKIFVDDNLRNQTAAALAGLDARRRKHLRHGASAVAWDHDGKRLLMGAAKNGTASLWDSDRDEETLFEHAGEGPVTFLADGTPVQLVADRKDRWSVALWDVGTGRPIQRFEIPPRGKAEAARPLNPVILAMTEDGNFVAAATSEADDEGSAAQGHLAAWESRTGQMLVQAEATVTALSLSPDGRVLAAGDADGRIRFWSLPEGKELEPLRSGRTAVDSLAFGRAPRHAEAGRAEGRTSAWLLATGETGGAVTVWDLQTRQVKSRCQGSSWNVHAVAFSPDGMTLASAGRSDAHLWDVASGRLLLKGWGLDWATAVAFSPNGRQLAVCSDHPVRGSAVLIYELEPGRGMQLLGGLFGPIAHVRFSPDARWVAALSHSWQVALWDTKENRLLHVLDVPKGYFADNADLCFSPNGRRFAFVTGRQAKVWEVESGRELESWDLPPGLVEMLAFRTNDELVLFRMETLDNQPPLGEVPWREHPRVCRLRHLADPIQAEPVATIRDFNRGVTTAAISRNGSYIVAVGRGGPDGQRQTIRIYDGISGKEVGTLPLNKTDAEPYLRLDTIGKILAYTPANGEQTTLVDVPSGRVRGILPGAPLSLGPGGNYWVSRLPGPGHTLLRTQDGRSLVMVAIDAEMSTDGSFSPDGRLWAWGHVDGSVTVCDLPAVQRRLAEVGLGW